MRVYLCDLSHETNGKFASELIPYPIACIASYISKENPHYDVRIFKSVPELDEAFELFGPPDVIGFSNYMWNINLSCKIAQHVKENHSDALVVMGGPNFPLDQDLQEQWMEDRPYVDCYVIGDGERAMLKICQDYMDGLKPDGIIAGESVYDLNEIPSPYLSGMLDRYLVDPRLIPVMESNRGCPVSCTFCVDGIDARSAVRKFEPDRLKHELSYIAERTSSKSMFMTDTNFGMYKEDVEFSEAFKAVQDEHDFPRYVIASTGKNNKARVIEVASNMDGALRVAASLQSMDDEVLESIKRKNIKKGALADMAQELVTTETNTYSELIVGLPGDTAEKHISGILELVDWGFDQIRMHQLTMLDGSEMATHVQRKEHEFVTRHRVLQRSFGQYHFEGVDIDSVESEEIVISNKTFQPADYLHCRAFGLTVALFYNERVFCELAGYIKSQGRKYSEFLLYLHDHIRAESDGPIKEVYDEFITSAVDEMFDDKGRVENLAPNEMQMLMNGESGNNLLFNAQGAVLYHHYDALCRMAFKQAAEFLGERSEYLLDLERYCSVKKGHLGELDGIAHCIFRYDFAEMEGTTWEELPEEKTVLLKFSFEDWQKELFSSLFEALGYTPQGLGKLIARAPIRHSYRQVETA